jgi:hypothetical protein
MGGTAAIVILRKDSIVVGADSWITDMGDETRGYRQRKVLEHHGIVFTMNGIATSYNGDTGELFFDVFELADRCLSESATPSRAANLFEGRMTTVLNRVLHYPGVNVGIINTVICGFESKRSISYRRNFIERTSGTARSVDVERIIDTLDRFNDIAFNPMGHGKVEAYDFVRRELRSFSGLPLQIMATKILMVARDAAPAAVHDPFDILILSSTGQKHWFYGNDEEIKEGLRKDPFPSPRTR